MMEGGSVSSSARSLSTLGWIPPGPIDLCVFKWLLKDNSRLLTASPGIVEASFCSHPCLPGQGAWAPREQLVLLLNSGAKTTLSTSSSPFVTVFPSTSDKGWRFIIMLTFLLQESGTGIFALLQKFLLTFMCQYEWNSF